jgi:hypothetical protein
MRVSSYLPTNWPSTSASPAMTTSTQPIIAATDDGGSGSGRLSVRIQENNPPVATWTINLGLDDSEVERIRNAAVEQLDSGQNGVVTEILPDGSAGRSSLSLDIEAGSAGGAIRKATSTWTQLRARSGLGPKPPWIGFIVGPMDQPSVYYDELLAKARGLAMAGRFEYAVVAAQTAFETYVRNLFRDLMRSVMPHAVAAAAQPRSATLRENSSQTLFEALTGRRIAESNDLWARYNRHVIRRNGVVHDGATAEEQGADESIDVVRRLIRRIEKVVQEGS